VLNVTVTFQVICEVGNFFTSVCFFLVDVSVCLQDYSETYPRTLVNVLESFSLGSYIEKQYFWSDLYPDLGLFLFAKLQNAALLIHGY